MKAAFLAILAVVALACAPSVNAERCETPPESLVSLIASDLSVSGGGSLRAAQAVRSGDHNRLWFIAADIQGPGMEGKGEIGVWATNDLNGPGLIFAVDGLAREFTTWGTAGDPLFSLTDDGVRESEACTRLVLQ